jgi:hypothetical protein
VYKLGYDSVTTDDPHFKNWAYVFMQEFEAGNYDKLYVTVQPGALTIYSTIAGYKSFYFLKDRLNFYQQLDPRETDLVLHTFAKVPKSLLTLGLLAIATHLVYQAFSAKVALLFLVLFGLDPYVLGNSRVIQTDVLPSYLVFSATLLFYSTKLKTHTSGLWVYGVLGCILGLSTIEKASSLSVLPVFVVLALWYEHAMSHKLRAVALLLSSCLATMVLLFPAFWGNFGFTLWRLTVGSFTQGIQGRDAERFTYDLTPHIYPWYFYLRFYYNQLSEVVWLGLIALAGLAINHKDRVYLTVKRLAPLLVVPLIFFVVHQVAVKKGGRYTLYTIPFIVLWVSLAYARLATKKVTFYALIAAVVCIRAVQFSQIFPDFLVYTNPLSVDHTYAKSYPSWSTGYPKLATFLLTTYGPHRKVHLGNHQSLRLYYPGKVSNFDTTDCSDTFDLVVQTTKFSAASCYTGLLTLNTTYSPYPTVTFYIYTTSRPI